ncbi:hypothetical protein [Flammeovirga kamogawensis]|uniref:DUF4138 domain-containing protein n=1 Tax=Flammeovirga kamogawensis TaxID=373891 RepID=A0ABX8GRJ2_9BACT|nr:hypothetical protein [Flammeovirga kamogawensis]MBB6462755.1 hypothetical protein [Flammeovirga kamogawensis]QWG06014.1 hypothetical protein KM029_11640 [Flammeovirga kamogawensis]TRX67845.1 hypothetical protein EO216_06660 [Flammeovirga kamogawensis]
MPRLLVLFIFLVPSLLSFAQEKNKKKQKKDKSMMGKIQADLEEQEYYERDSTVFYFPNWSQGNVILKTGEQFIDVPVLYDLQHDQVEILTVQSSSLYGGMEILDTTIVTFESHTIESFKMIEVNYDEDGTETGTTDFNFINADIYLREGVPALGIYQEILKGDLSLLAYPYLLKTIIRPNTTFDEERLNNEARGVHSNPHKNEVLYDYALKEKLYFLIDNSHLQLVDTRKKHLLKVFVGKESEVASYISKNNVNFRQKEGLIELIKYYNSML